MTMGSVVPLRFGPVLWGEELAFAFFHIVRIRYPKVMDFTVIIFPFPFDCALVDVKVAVASETFDGSLNFG